MMIGRRYSDDDVFDERGLLRDGRRLRVGMLMRDAKGAPHDAPTPANAHRPGFRVGDSSARAAILDARADYERALTEAWRQPLDVTGVVPPAGSYPPPQVAGSACTIDGKAGRLELEAASGYYSCRPLASDAATTEREAAHRAYDHEVRNAWRTPL